MFLISNSIKIIVIENKKLSRMEDSTFLLELKFVSAMAASKFMKLLCLGTTSSLSLFSSNPLLSCIVTFCTLVLLYLPHLFWKIVLSPVLILTGILLLTILRLGATQRSQIEQKESPGISEPTVKEQNKESKEEKEKNFIEPEETNSLEKVYQWITGRYETKSNSEMGFDSNSCFEETFKEWNVKAPLEVIYEEYEGEEETEEDPNEQEDTRSKIPRYPSLSRYYPESDSDSSSDGGFPPKGNWDSPENICFRWDEEDREGLIEIALEGCKKTALEFQFEEENLIEIDISPTRHRDFSGENELFSGDISCN